jgi:hypothetical protein
MEAKDNVGILATMRMSKVLTSKFLLHDNGIDRICNYHGNGRDNGT